MRAPSSFHSVIAFVAFSLVISFAGVQAFGQDVGADIIGGAGIFRPKNPESKKRTGRTTGGTRRGASARPSTAGSTVSEDRIEDLLEKGNQFRDARRFAEAEGAYQSILKLKPRDGRAAYGLGNIYSDQQRWEEAEAAYRNAASLEPDGR